MSDLTPVQQDRLGELEEIVVVGLRTFTEIGLALCEIRDERLYRGTHETFETYLDERFGISRSQGYRLIDAARVVELVSPMGDITNERQARELVPLLDEPEELIEAWEEAMHTSNGKPTAAGVAEAVKSRRVISDEDRTRIRALHADGKNQKEIAETTGWSAAAVSKVLRAGEPPKESLPKRRQAATAQTRTIGKLHNVIREWDKLGAEEDYIPAPELARRIRVLDAAMTFLTRKRAHYYGRKDEK